MTNKNKIVVDGVVYYLEPPDLTKAKIVLDRWEAFKSRLATVYEKGKRDYAAATAVGLNINSIEREGYLRCANEVKAIIEELEAATPF